MYNTFEQYLAALKNELGDDKPVLLRDALADARARLSMALEVAREKTPKASVSAAMKSILKKQDSPEAAAAAYRETDRQVPATMGEAAKPAWFLGKVLGVYLDPRTWGALFFMFISFVAGTVYFTWAVTGLALSLSFLILIIGLPFAVLFLLSVRGLGLVESRLVEVLLGVSMPRWPLVAEQGSNWLERFKALVTDKHTWLSLLYLVLQMPLGVIYFTINVTLIALALGIMAAPAVQVFGDTQIITINNSRLFAPIWALGLMELGGFLALTATLHLIRSIGRWHGKYAKALLGS